MDHLLLEASIGRLYHSLHTTALCTVYDEVEVDPFVLVEFGAYDEDL